MNENVRIMYFVVNQKVNLMLNSQEDEQEEMEERR